MSSHVEAIGERLLDATSRVFEENGVLLSERTRCEPASDWLDPIAVIGFGGETLRGSVSFEVPWRVLQASHPTKSTAQEDLVDWVGELANLTLGKLKTELRGCSVSIQLGLPTTFTTRAAETGATGSSQLQYRVRAPDGDLRVRFSAQVDAGFAMAPSPHEEVVHGLDLF